jgi:recombination associated protein RdgC
VLTDKLQVKRVEFLEIAKDKPDNEAVTPEEQFDIDFLLMTGELNQMITDLREALGGEPAQEKQKAA